MQHIVIADCMPSTRPTAQDRAFRMIVARMNQIAHTQIANTGGEVEEPPFR